MYSTAMTTDLGPIFSSTNMSTYQPWNSFHSILKSKSFDKEFLCDKFHLNTNVKLESGQIKSIKQITTHDFLLSTKQSPKYSGLLARIDYIGNVDKITGKAELRFFINGIDKPISYYVSQEMPFFVYQYSCWSSISPEYTRRLCGLNCRQLECGDLIMAITEREKSNKRSNMKPDYTQQSPMKCLVERYLNEKISSTKDSSNTFPENKRFKISKD